MRNKYNFQILTLIAPSVICLLIWMMVPLLLAINFSFQDFYLQDLSKTGYVGFKNYFYLFNERNFLSSLITTLIFVISIILFTVTLGLTLSVLLNQDFYGKGLTRILVISPFLVAPTVAAGIWKLMLMSPTFGLFKWVSKSFGYNPIDWFGDLPLFSIIIIVCWQWLPFALLILLTALQSLPKDQVEAARIDGANELQIFISITINHLKRPIAIVIMLETIFVLNLFAHIYSTTNGGPGNATTNLPYLIYQKALLDYDVGGAAAGGIIAVIFANIVAFFLLSFLSKNIN